MLDPVTASRRLPSLLVPQGLVMNVGPKLCNKMYGIKGRDSNAMAQFLVGQFVARIHWYCIYLCCLLFLKTNLVTANKAVYAF